MIPGFLSVECSRRETEGLGKQCFFRILPSELLAIRFETEAWSDYPSSYSYAVLRAVSYVTALVRERELMNWVIASSPRYGVVIDVALTDNIVSLFSLCLKAIVREALNLDGDQSKGKNTSFECPVLVQSLIWFTSQLSILYGETSGKFFAINMLKQCISEAAAPGLMMSGSPTLKEEGSHSKNELNLPVTEKAIFVSQVIAAINALHERALVEGRINGFGMSQPLTLAEYDYVSQRADEERKTRPNYRPIIEHDGLHWQRTSYQESSKTKTREELLAEERDYKRRRMSYRGKKGKRTTLQVTRDIIEEYMVEISKAGGIGCFTKETEDGSFPSEPHSAHDITTNVDGPTGSRYEANVGGKYNNRQQSYSDYSKRSESFKEASPIPKEFEQQRQSLRKHHEDLDKKFFNRNKNDMDNYSRSSGRYKNRGQSHMQSSHLLEQDDLEVTRIPHLEVRQSYSGRTRYDDGRSYPVSDSVNEFSVRKDERKSKVEHRWQSNRRGNVSSDILGQNAFEDRYNPPQSPDMNEDEFPTGKQYVRQNKLRVKEFRDQPGGHSATEHYLDYHDKSE